MMRKGWRLNPDLVKRYEERNRYRLALAAQRVQMEAMKAWPNPSVAVTGEELAAMLMQTAPNKQ